MPNPFLPSALTIPELTEWLKPKGFPIETAKSPTLNWSESATGICVRGVSVLIFKTAISVLASAPTNSASSFSPLLRVT